MPLYEAFKHGDSKEMDDKYNTLRNNRNKAIGRERTRVAKAAEKRALESGTRLGGGIIGAAMFVHACQVPRAVW